MNAIAMKTPSEQHWNDLLLASFIRKKAHPTLLSNIDDVIVWLSQFDEKESYSQQCITQVGSVQQVKYLTLSFIDELLLITPNQASSIFTDSKGLFVEAFIKKRYRRLCRVFHPDKSMHSKEWLSKRMVTINQAYDDALNKIRNDQNTLTVNTSFSVIDGVKLTSSTPAKVNLKKRQYAADSAYYQSNDITTTRLYRAVLAFANKSRFFYFKVFYIISLIVALSILLPILMKQSSTKDNEGIEVNDNKQNYKNAINLNEPINVDINDAIDELLVFTSTNTSPLREDPEQISAQLSILKSEEISRTVSDNTVHDNLKTKVHSLFNELEMSYNERNPKTFSELFVNKGLYFSTYGKQAIENWRTELNKTVLNSRIEITVLNIQNHQASITVYADFVFSNTREKNAKASSRSIPIFVELKLHEDQLLIKKIKKSST